MTKTGQLLRATPEGYADTCGCMIHLWDGLPLVETNSIGDDPRKATYIGVLEPHLHPRDDCPCMLGVCTLRRLDKLPKIEWEPGEHEAFMDAMGYGSETTEEVAP